MCVKAIYIHVNKTNMNAKVIMQGIVTLRRPPDK